MFENSRILALIPARGGSKGIKNKNIIPVAGKPLIAYSIDAALHSKYVDDIVVTTDSQIIADVAKEYGARVPFLRPDYLASDTAKTIDAVIHAVDELKNQGHSYDVLLLLQPTQPLRTSEDIDAAIELFYQNNQKATVSVSPVDDHPLLIRTVSSDGCLTNLLNTGSTCRRQDMPDYYRVNGCIYLNKISEVDKDLSFNDNKLAYIMPRERAVDIDEPKDLLLAEYYLNNGTGMN